MERALDPGLASELRATPRASVAPYALLFPFIAVVLFVDGRRPGHAMQALLGVLTTAFLVAVLRQSNARERRETIVCIVFSTLVEVVSTQLWGLYGYRLGNVPLYVPPGHGLIFVTVAKASGTMVVTRGSRVLAGVVALVATVWAAGAVFLPARPDLHGAIYWPFLLGFLAFSSKRAVWALTFVVTSFIELLGVAWGTWHWHAEIPGFGIPSGDPPSLVAGGYCTFALVAMTLARQKRPSARETLDPPA